MIYRLAVLDALTPSMFLSEPMREASLDMPHAEWIVIPLILAAAVPDVAVTIRCCDIPLLANSSRRASMIRDLVEILN